MASSSEVAKASQAYDAAYALHYTEDNLLEALIGYRELITCYPDTPQARNSRTQLGNIARQVIPDEALMDAQVDLARAALER